MDVARVTTAPEGTKSVNDMTSTGATVDACGAQCMDIVTASLITMATLAVVVIACMYLFAGICKRVR